MSKVAGWSVCDRKSCMVILPWSKVFGNTRDTFAEESILIKAAGLQQPSYLPQTPTQAIFQQFTEIGTSEQLKKLFPT